MGYEIKGIHVMKQLKVVDEMSDSRLGVLSSRCYEESRVVDDLNESWL